LTKNARDTRKCTARNAGTKKRCNRWAMKGQTVCCAHGGETAPAESDPFESVESLQAWVEAQKNRDGRVACMFGTPVDEHDGCRWCHAAAMMGVGGVTPLRPCASLKRSQRFVGISVQIRGLLKTLRSTTGTTDGREMEMETDCETSDQGCGCPSIGGQLGAVRGL